MENVGLNTMTVILPTSRKVTIREQNGNDEDVISRVGDSSNNTAIAKFLAGIIIEPKTSWQQVMKWQSQDKYVLLLQSRIFNLGDTLSFKHTFEDGTEETFEEDLSVYTIDNTDNKYAPKSYPLGLETEVEFTTSLGKVVKYTLLNSDGEAYNMGKPEGSASRNDIFRCRFLSVKDHNTKSGWKVVEKFYDFKPIELSEIRKNIMENDPTFDMLMEISHPVSNQKVLVPMIQYTEFFFL